MNLFCLKQHEILIPQRYQGHIIKIDQLVEAKQPCAILLDWRQPLQATSELNMVEKPSLQQSAYLFDTLVHTDRWEPYFFLNEGFAAVYSHFQLSYGPLDWVYVTELNPQSQVFIHLLFARGYRKFRIIQAQESQLESSLDLENLFLGAIFEFISLSKMVLLKPEGRVLVCSQDLETMGEDAVAAMSYFNFLRKKSVIFDLFPDKNHWIRSEAKATEMDVIDYQMCSLVSTWVFIKKFINPKLTWQECINEF